MEYSLSLVTRLFKWVYHVCYFLQMKWIGLVCLCLWTLCSGAPQDCSGYGGCDMEEVDPDVTTPVPGSTTTPEPDTGDLARQQDLRAPIPISLVH